MHPSVWGQHFWYTMHLAALGYPDTPTADEQKQYENFYKNLYHVLPCSKCSAHYRQHLLKYPVDASSRATLFAWTVKIHNIVNAKNGKPTWSVERALQFYERSIALQCSPNECANVLHSTAFWKGFVLSAFLIAIVYLIWFLSRSQPSKPTTGAAAKRKEP